MRLFRLTITDFGLIQRARAQSARWAVRNSSYRAFTVQGASAERIQPPELVLENNHKYRLALAIVETLPNVAAVWIESIESETPAVKLIELIRDEASPPPLPTSSRSPTSCGTGVNRSRRQPQEHRPEFFGEVFTSTEELSPRERIGLFKAKDVLMKNPRGRLSAPDSSNDDQQA